MIALVFLVTIAVTAFVGFLVGVWAERDRHVCRVDMVPSLWQLKTWRKERR